MDVRFWGGGRQANGYSVECLLCRYVHWRLGVLLNVLKSRRVIEVS